MPDGERAEFEVLLSSVAMLQRPHMLLLCARVRMRVSICLLAHRVFVFAPVCASCICVRVRAFARQMRVVCERVCDWLRVLCSQSRVYD